MLVPLAFASALAALTTVIGFTGFEPSIVDGLIRDGLESENNTRLMLAFAAPVFSPLLLFAFALLGLHQLYRVETLLPLTSDLNRARVLNAIDESLSHAALAVTLPLLLFWLMWVAMQGGPVSGVLVGLVSGSVLCYIAAGMLLALNWKARQRARAAGLTVPAWGWLTGALGFVVVMGLLPAGAALFQLLNWPMGLGRSGAFWVVVGEMLVGAFLLRRLRAQTLTQAARQLRSLAPARAVSGLLGVIVTFTVGGMLLIPPAQATVGITTRMVDALLSYAQPYTASTTLRQILIDHYLIGAQVFLLIAVAVAALVSVSILIYWGLTAKKVSGE